MAQQWDAFISYAREASTREAISLAQGIESFAKPWNQLRGCRLFRDDSSMAANPALWPTIESALAESRYLIILLTPAASASVYVGKEVRWWLEKKSADTILLVRCQGALRWDPAKRDFAAESDCVPTALRGAYRDEPRWVDFSWFSRPGSLETRDPRFPEVVADLAAPVRNRQRDELIGESVRLLKRARNLARAGVSTLVVLLVVAIITASTAVTQRNQIALQAVTLQARQLATLADSFSATDVQRSQLFAVAGLRAQQSQETRSALFRSMVSAPALQGFQNLPSNILTLQVARNGQAVAVGLKDGGVYRIDPSRQAPPTLLFDFDDPVWAISLSGDGSVIAAVDTNSKVKYWRDGRTAELQVPVDKEASLVAVSPEGLSIVVGGPGAGHASSPGLDFFDARTGTATSRLADPHSGDKGDWAASSIQGSFIEENKLALVGPSLGIAILQVSDGTLLLDESIPWFSDGLPVGKTVFSDDGLWYLHASAVRGESIGVWSTLKRAADQEDAIPPAAAGIQYASIEDCAVTSDGQWVVVSDAKGLHVRQAAQPAKGPAAASTISLTGGLVASQVAFLDAPTRLVSATGTSLAFWDTESPGRLADETALSPESPDIAYGGNLNDVRFATSPDGNSYASLDLHSGVVQRGSLPGRSGVPQARTELRGADGLALGQTSALHWTDNSNLVILSDEVPAETPAWLRTVVTKSGQSARVTGEGSVAVSVLIRQSGSGNRLTIDRYEVESGHSLSTITINLPANSMAYETAVSTDGSVVGYLLLTDDREGSQDQRSVVFVDSSSGAVLHQVTLNPDNYLLMAIDGLDAVVVIDDHAELWRDLGRGGREAFGEQPLLWTPASAQKNPPVLSAAHIALTTKTGTALYARDGLAEVGAIPVPTERIGHPRATLFGDHGRLLIAYLGPTENTARLTAWELDAEVQRAQACVSSGRQLDETEWTRLVGVGTKPDLVCA